MSMRVSKQSTQILRLTCSFAPKLRSYQEVELARHQIFILACRMHNVLK